MCFFFFFFFSSRRRHTRSLRDWSSDVCSSDLWQLEHLAAQGIERVTYSIGYRGDLLREHVGDGSRFGLRVSWVDEGKRLLGTGGAIRLALDEGALDEAFFVLYGDSYLPVSMSDVERAWRQSGQPALMTVLRNEG